MVPPRYFSWPSIGLFITIAILPLIYLITSPFQSQAETVSLWSIFEGRHLSLASNSLIIAFGTSTVSLLWGASLAFFICRTDIPGLQLLKYTFFFPLLIPPYIHAIVWEHLAPVLLDTLHFDIHSVAGIIMVLSLAYFPFVTITTMAGLKNCDRNKEEAALLVKSPLNMLCRVTLPLCIPSMLSGTLFVFVFAITNVGVADTFRVRVYPLEVFIQYSAFFDSWKAMLLSLPLVAITIAFIIIQRLFMGNQSYVSIGAGEEPSIRFGLGQWGKILFLFYSLLVGCAFFLPVGVLLYKAGGITTYLRILESSVKPIQLSFVIALTAALLCTVLGGSLGYLQQRLGTRYRLFLSLLIFIPLAIPATTMGIGLIGVWNHAPLGWIYSSAAIMVIAHMARFTPYAAVVVHSGVQQLSPRIEESALLSGANFFSIWFSFLMQLTKRQHAAAAIIVFILAFGDLGTTLLVCPPGIETIPVKIYNLMHYGADEMVAALCITLMLITFSISLAFFWFLRK